MSLIKHPGDELDHGLPFVAGSLRAIEHARKQSERRRSALEVSLRAQPAAFEGELRPLPLASTNGVQRGWPRGGITRPLTQQAKAKAQAHHQTGQRGFPQKSDLQYRRQVADPANYRASRASWPSSPPCSRVLSTETFGEQYGHATAVSAASAAAPINLHEQEASLLRRTGSIMLTFDPSTSGIRRVKTPVAGSAYPGKVAAVKMAHRQRAATGFALTRDLELTERALIPHGALPESDPVGVLDQQLLREAAESYKNMLDAGVDDDDGSASGSVGSLESLESSMSSGLPTESIESADQRANDLGTDAKSDALAIAISSNDNSNNNTDAFEVPQFPQRRYEAAGPLPPSVARRAAALGLQATRPAIGTEQQPQKQLEQQQQRRGKELPQPQRPFSLTAQPPAMPVNARHEAACAWVKQQEREHNARPLAPIHSSLKPTLNQVCDIQATSISSRSPNRENTKPDILLLEPCSRPRSRQQPAAAAPLNQVGSSTIWPGDANEPLRPDSGLPSEMTIGAGVDISEFNAFFSGALETGALRQRQPL